MTKAINANFPEMKRAAGAALLALTLVGCGAKPPLSAPKDSRATPPAEQTPRKFEVAPELLVAPPPPPRAPGKGPAS